MDDAWQQRRLELFQPCAESVVGQGVEWLLLVDSATPKWVLTALGEHDAAIISCKQQWLADLQRYLHLPRPTLTITSRLDSDDRLMPGAMDAVRASARGRTEFLCLADGLVDRGGEMFPSRHRSGPFLSYYEYGRSPQSVYCVEHGHAKPIRHTHGGPYWIQTIHSGNVRNK